VVGIGRDGQGKLLEICSLAPRLRAAVVLTLSLEETGDTVSLVAWDSRQELFRCFQVAAQDRGLILHHSEAKSIARDVEVLVGDVDPVVRGEVTEQENAPDRQLKLSALVETTYWSKWLSTWAWSPMR